MGDLNDRADVLHRSAGISALVGILKYSHGSLFLGAAEQEHGQEGC